MSPLNPEADAGRQAALGPPELRVAESSFPLRRRRSEKFRLAAAAVNHLAERRSRAVAQPALALPLADLTLGHADGGVRLASFWLTVRVRWIVRPGARLSYWATG